MNDRLDISPAPRGDDAFEALARTAGEELRRPAPAGGPDRIRKARRRQQQVRAAAGGVALTAIVAVGAAVVMRDQPPSVANLPDVTTADTTDATTPITALPEPITAPSIPASTTPPAPTSPAETMPPTQPTLSDPISAEALEWIAAQQSDGFVTVDIRNRAGTTARLLTATNASVDTRAAVVLDNGRVIETPEGVPAFELFGVGGKPAVVQSGGGPDQTTQVWVLDEATEDWTSTGDLGIGPLRSNTTLIELTVLVVDDVLIVANNAFDEVADNLFVPSPDRRGVVVRADMSVTAMAAPPDGVTMFFTSSAGGKALQLYAPNLGSQGADIAYDQPWQYDPQANEWSEIPIPTWADCDACEWVAGYDIGNIELEVPVGRGVVAIVPDGTIGFYDPAARTWTRFDDAPFALDMPTVAVVDDQVVVAPWRTFENDFSLLGVLDVASGTWTTGRVEIPADVEAHVEEQGWIDLSWDLRTANGRVMAVPGPSFGQSFGQSDLDPIAVYDTTTRTWGEPTADDVTAWRALANRLAS